MDKYGSEPPICKHCGDEIPFKRGEKSVKDWQRMRHCDKECVWGRKVATVEPHKPCRNSNCDKGIHRKNYINNSLYLKREYCCMDCVYEHRKLKTVQMVNPPKCKYCGEYIKRLDSKNATEWAGKKFCNREHSLLYRKENAKGPSKASKAKYVPLKDTPWKRQGDDDLLRQMAEAHNKIHGTGNLPDVYEETFDQQKRAKQIENGNSGSFNSGVAFF